MPTPRSQGETKDATMTCPKCRGEMHPLYLYEDREPDTWLCFDCGHLEWVNPGQGRQVPPVDQ